VLRARELIDDGRYRHATEILDKLVHAHPDDAEARQLLADAFEQIGYQQESPSVRNSFLAGALELRSGIPTGAVPNSSSPDIIRAVSTSQFLDFLGIRLDSEAVADDSFTVNLLTPDTGETFVVELSNGALTNLPGFLADDPDLTITVDRSDLEDAMTAVAPLQQQIADGRVVLDGDAGVLATLASGLVQFSPDFEMLPGTATDRPAAADDVFAQSPLADSSGG
jgi:alkyl sulfatase BDS1-like metallo-beta-lactamase superfamily hydrolase